MISEREDYGLSAAETLAHPLDPSAPLPAPLPEGFDEYWARFREEVSALPLRWQGSIDVGGPGEVGGPNQVVMRSLDSVRIVGQVMMPFAQPRGIVITTHGYANVPEPFPSQEPWTERGLATLRVRVRGYPPSTIDIGDLRPPRGWIMHRIESPQAWILRGAVADVMTAVRCARAHFPDLPIALHGESLGGGLAVIAAAQLGIFGQEKPQMTPVDSAKGNPIHRLILACPSLGDWRWRAGRYCNGAGGEVNVLLDALRGREQDNLLRTLLLFDAALHARAVTVPCLCKLAERDDVVPAPSAAAVFNALASPRKWRFVTRYGHFEGGIADLRRHALFERIHPAFADPTVACEEAVAGLEPAPAALEARYRG